MIAPMLLKKTLKELFEDLVNSKLLIYNDGLLSKDTFIRSIEFSINEMENKDPKAISIFYLLGVSYEGLSYEQIEDIFSLA